MMPFNDKPTPAMLADEFCTRWHIKTIQESEEIYKWNEQTGLYENCEFKLKAEIQREIGNLTTTHYVNEVLNAARRLTYIPENNVAADLNLIPLKNGVYDFAEETFLPYSPEKIFLSKHPITYFPDEPPVDNPIDKFIEEVTGSQEDAVLLKELAGYLFYRDMPFQNFFLLVGKGANGKSVYLNLLERMAGTQNTSHESLQGMIDNSRFSQAHLYRKNVNIFGDLSNKALQDVSILKHLTGGDTIRGEVKFSKKNFYFKNYAKIIASCNEVPESNEDSVAFFRRSILVDFPYCFEGRENRNLFNEIATPENLGYFFKTCISAFKMALQDNKWARHETPEQKRDKYMSYSNSAASFCVYMLEYDPESELPTDKIYAAYLKYCEQKKIPSRDERSFFMKLYRAFNNKAYKRRNSVAGIREYVIKGVNWAENACL